MIKAGEFKNGKTIVYNGDAYRVIEFQHVKPGKGSPFVRTKLKGIVKDKTIETAFDPKDNFDEAVIDRFEMQYLYKDDDNYYFMVTDESKMNEDDEMYPSFPVDEIAEEMKFVKEGDKLKALSYEKKIFSVEPDLFVELAVIETEPGFKGNTATNTLKPCTVETGAQVMVPTFVEIGDVLQIDTRTGEYLKRV